VARHASTHLGRSLLAFVPAPPHASDLDGDTPRNPPPRAPLPMALAGRRLAAAPGDSSEAEARAVNEPPREEHGDCSHPPTLLGVTRRSPTSFSSRAGTLPPPGSTPVDGVLPADFLCFNTDALAGLRRSCGWRTAGGFRKRTGPT